MSPEEDTSALDDAERAAEREAETYRGGSDQPVACSAPSPSPTCSDSPMGVFRAEARKQHTSPQSSWASRPWFFFLFPGPAPAVLGGSPTTIPKSAWSISNAVRS